jgi:hypothetical protein
MFDPQGFGKDWLGGDRSVQRLALAALAVVVVGVSGCGSRSGASKPEPKPPNLLQSRDTVGRVPKEPFVVGAGDRRIVLTPSGDQSGELCVKAATREGTTQRRCLGPGLPDPVVAFVGIGGRSEKRVDWASLIGLARADVARVTLRLQSGPPRTLELRRWAGFDWSGFSLEPGAGGTLSADLIGGRQPNRPNDLQAFDAKGRKLIDLELSWVYGPCERNTPCKGSDPPKKWQDVQDPFVGASGADRVESRVAKEIALRDPLVARLLSDRRYVFMPSSAWVDCANSSIGVVHEVYVADPIAYEGDFPFASYNHASGKAYDESVWHLAVGNATALLLNVDLHRKKVVGVDPTFSDGVQVDESKSHVVKKQAVPDDNLDCDGSPEGD